MIVNARVGESASAPFTVLSPKLWGFGSNPSGSGFPKGNVIIDAGGDAIGKFFYEDFTDFPLLTTATSGIVKGWNYFLSSGGLIADAAIANLNAATFSSDGDNEAAILAKMLASIRITKNSMREVFFETRVKFSTIADTKNGAFFGLFEPITPTATSHIAASGALVDANYIGFHRPESTSIYSTVADSTNVSFVYKADGQTQQITKAIASLTADTWIKLGFAFDGVQTLKVFVNGQEYTAARLGATALDAVTFPSDINLAPAIVGALNATGTTPGSNTVNWLAFGYTNNRADGYA